MSSPGGPRRGSALLVAVIVVSMLGLGLHGSRYAALAAGRLHPAAAQPAAAAGGVGGRGAGSVPSTPSPSTPSTPSTASDASNASNAYGATGSLQLSPSCLRSDNPPTSARIPADDPFSKDLSGYGKGAQLQRLYAVKDRQIVPLDGAGPVRGCDAQLWSLVSRTTPDHVIAVVSEFMVFDADPHAPADADVVLGEVEPRLGHDPSSWRLAIAPNGSSDIDLAIDVAHEVGHLASLNNSQVRPADPCRTEETDVGCLTDGSFLVGFTDTTWTDAEWKEWNAAVDHADDTTVHRALDAFAAAHAADFVTPYAATDPTEDFAETFAYWCVFGPHNPLMADYLAGDPTDGAAKIAWMDKSAHGIADEHLRGCERMRELTR